jgi:hypothetical protein
MKTLLPTDYTTKTLLPYILDKIPNITLETESDSNYDEVLDCTIQTQDGTEFLQLEILDNVWIDIAVSTSNGEDLDIELENLIYYDGIKDDVHFEIEQREETIIKDRITKLTTIY